MCKQRSLDGKQALAPSPWVESGTAVEVRGRSGVMK